MSLRDPVDAWARKRILALEKRVKELEKLTGVDPGKNTCPHCGRFCGHDKTCAICD